MSRVDQYQVHLVGPNNKDCGDWLTFDGGGVDSTEAFTRDGYGLPREALGGQPTLDNITMERTFKANRDPDMYRYLRGQAGKGRFGGSVQLLDGDGFAVGKPEPFQGTLKSVKKAAVNIEGSDAMKITIEITTDGPVNG